MSGGRKSCARGSGTSGKDADRITTTRASGAKKGAQISHPTKAVALITHLIKSCYFIEKTYA
jgi:hypothetical protein